MHENTGRAVGGTFRTALIEQVHEGMQVVDSAGDEVGKVELVKMGDPEAATTQGSESEARGLIGAIGRALTPDEAEPDVPAPLRDNLLRTGFLKVDGPGLFGTDRYVRADLIQAVSPDRVILVVRKDQLPREI
jgi:hypothetical protein